MTGTGNDGLGSDPVAGDDELRDEIRNGAPLGRRSHRLVMRIIWGCLGFGVLLVVLGAIWYHSVADPGKRGNPVVLEVASGSSVSGVTSRLAALEVVRSALAFRVYLLVSGAPVIEPGEFLMYRNESFSAVKHTLAGGPNIHTITVTPGTTVSEVDAQVAAGDGGRAPSFTALVQDAAVRSTYEQPGSNSLEGLLGPGSYQLMPGESDEQLLSQMVSKFEAEAAQLGLDQGARQLGLTAYQALTVASIDQKEGVYPQNLGKVARVILNRLAIGMRLQMDSTVLYAEGRDGGAVSKQDELLASPYNTYLNAGLTPTPTCFPSAAAVEAAFNPTPGNWRYFVLVSKDGTEAFSDTYAGQLANEALAQSRGVP